MVGEERIDALEVGTGGEKHGISAPVRIGAAGGGKREQQKGGTSGRKHSEV
jgi:hypothetical protein